MNHLPHNAFFDHRSASTSSGAFSGIPVLDVLERLLSGGMRHREEMARIQMAEKEMQEQYRLQNRQLDAAFQYAMKQLEERSRQLDRQFQFQLQAMAVDAEESGTLQLAISQAMQIATSEHTSEPLRLAAMAMLPGLVNSLNVNQAGRNQKVLQWQQHAQDRLMDNRDNPFLLQHYSGDEP